MRQPRIPRPAKDATKAERRDMLLNLWIVVCDYERLSDEAYAQAKASAIANPGKASRCYAAVVRSLQYRG